MKLIAPAPRRWLADPSKPRIRQYDAQFAKSVRPEMLVLDAGSGRAPYRDLFAHARYETADFAQLKREYHKITYVCDLTDIPVEDARFDRVICNQVLEHVPDPAAVLRELARVMKDDGRILLSTPFFYHLHNRPYDFFRYTPYSLRKLFQDAEFEVEQLEWIESYFASVGLQFQHMGRFLPRKVKGHGKSWKWWLAAPVVHGLRISAPTLAAFFYELDRRWKYTANGYPQNYVVIARRRGRTS
jgi:2-polyprenyl-3-methyl-5-hydroxy-6-metoxy-1,4-benzoquinol methylase